MRPFAKKLTQLALTLHIYLSMAGFMLILLFAVTGLTLNHADFGLSEPRIEESTIAIPPQILAPANGVEATAEEVTAAVRAAAGVTAPVSSYGQYDDEIEIAFSAPGMRVFVVVNTLDGSGYVERETRGFLGKIGDLHKGYESGPVWYWVIDVTAILLTISAITGIVTLASLPNRRRAGFAAGIIGVLLAWIVWIVLPG